MLNCDQWSDLGTDRQTRATLALYDLIKMAVPKGQAVSIVAITMSECDGHWLQRRSSPPLLFDHDCWPSRTCVGLEYGMGADGKRIWSRSAMLDPDFRNQVVKMKGASPSETDGKGGLLIAGGMKGANSDDLAALWEWVIANRNAAGLRSFSLGPTQMWMGQVKLSLDYVRSKGLPTEPAGYVKTFPQTWEEMFELYTAQDIGTIFKWLHYLDTSAWPGDEPWNKERGIHFLATKQTGTSKAESYYNSWYGPNVRFCSTRWDALKRGEDTPAGLKRLNEAEPMIVAEASNPGPVGMDTGYSFVSPSSGQRVRVIAHDGESRESAIRKVRSRHGLV